MFTTVNTSYLRPHVVTYHQTYPYESGSNISRSFQLPYFSHESSRLAPDFKFRIRLSQERSSLSEEIDDKFIQNPNIVFLWFSQKSRHPYSVSCFLFYLTRHL